MSRSLIPSVLTAVALFSIAFLARATVFPWFQPQAVPTSDPLLVAEGAVSKTDRGIGALQERLRQRPADAASVSALGLLYLQKARETGDPSYYRRAETALQQAAQEDPEQGDVLIGLGALALSRHDFQEALVRGQQAVAAQPTRAAAWGVVSDALVELGRDDEALQAVQHMVDLRPDQASFARVSYVRELHGDRAGAVQMMELAVQSGPSGTEPTEWARVHLGNLHFNAGDLDRAETTYQTAATLLPGYVHAVGGLARVAAARGKTDEAVALYQRALATNPLPELVMQLVDVLIAAHRESEAEQLIALMDAMERLFSANGADMDLELALFDADHDRNLAQAESRVRDRWERTERRSTQVADAYAWVLYKIGNCALAQRFSEQGFRLGAREALPLFHAGMIASCNGHGAEARALLTEALSVNPYFSPRYAPDARRLLQTLEAS